MQRLNEIIKERILILDGAMGTMIQGYGLNEDDFRGQRFKDTTVQMKGNNDMLCLTQAGYYPRYSSQVFGRWR